MLNTEKQLNGLVLDRAKSNAEKSHMLFWIMMIGFMCLIYVRNIMKIEFPIAIMLIYICIMAFLASREEMVAIAISFVPFSAAFQYRYALLCLIVIYTVKFIDDVKRSKINVYIPLVLMMVWEVLHAFVGAFSFVSYFQGFSELIFLTFIIALPKKKFDFPFIARVLAITVAFSCTIVLLKLLAETNYDFGKIFTDGNYRFGISDENADSYVMNYNANALGYMCNFGIAGLLLRIRKTKTNVFDVFVMAVMAFYGLLTLSRMFIICLGFLLVMYMLASEKRVGKVIKNIAIISLVAVIVLFVFNMIIPYIFENIVARFNEDDVTGGRAFLLEWYGEQIFGNPKILFFGTGIQNLVKNINELAHIEITSVPHNGMQELLAAWGLPGCAMFVYFCVVMIKESKVAGVRRNFMNFIPALLMFLVTQSGQLITSGIKLTAFVFVYVAMCTTFQVNKKQRVR